MSKTRFLPATLLVLGCCLVVALSGPYRAHAGAIPVADSPSYGFVGNEHFYGAPEPQRGYAASSLSIAGSLQQADTGSWQYNATCAFEPEAAELGGLQTEYPEDKRVQILTDLQNIYTSPIRVNSNDLCLLAVSGGTLLLVDQEVYDRINSGPRSPEARQISAIVTELGNGLSALAICGLISLKDPETAYLGVNAVAYSGLACMTLKAAFGRARPWTGEGQYAFYGPTISCDYNSMPSGHSATAFALATVLAKQYPEHKRIFYACASLVALSRIYVHSHWPSDVLVGAALGIWSANQVVGSSKILEVRW